MKNILKKLLILTVVTAITVGFMGCESKKTIEKKTKAANAKLAEKYKEEEIKNNPALQKDANGNKLTEEEKEDIYGFTEAKKAVEEYLKFACSTTPDKVDKQFENIKHITGIELQKAWGKDIPRIKKENETSKLIDLQVGTTIKHFQNNGKYMYYVESNAEIIRSGKTEKHLRRNNVEVIDGKYIVTTSDFIKQ